MWRNWGRSRTIFHISFSISHLSLLVAQTASLRRLAACATCEMKNEKRQMKNEKWSYSAYPIALYSALGLE
jgi:hypothetical protein